MILVTGATGILGRVIVLELLKKGFQVRATKRPTSNLKEVRESFDYYTDKAEDYFNLIQWVDVDFEDIHSLQKTLENIDEVYHCAAKVSFSSGDEKALYQSNVKATENLLYAVENSSVKKFLYVSSIAVLDGVNEEGFTDENSDFNPKVDHSSYALSKHYAEMEVWRANAEGLNTVIINPGIIIGSGNWGNSSGDLFQKSSYSRTFSGGSAYVDVRDVARIAVELMARNAFGERFVLVAGNEKFKLISDKVRTALGKPKAKVLPKFVIRLLSTISLLFGCLIPKLKLLSKTNMDTLESDSYISNKKIKNYLDYQFIPVEESVDFHLRNYLKSIK